MNKKSEQVTPPKFARRLIEKIYSAKTEYNRAGDLDEVFYDIADRKSVLSAGFWYWSQVLKAIRYSMKNFFYWRINMLKNYLKIAYRNTMKQKMYSFINISGFALGMAACFLILLWINDEVNYDDFHANRDNIYRLIERTERGVFSVTDGAFGAALEKDVPEVLDYARVFPANKRLLTYENRSHYYSERLVDPSFFNVFSFPFVQGDPVSALSEPGSIIITERIADDLFGGGDPFGKTIIISGNQSLIVTGVMKNVPVNSHLQFDFLLPVEYNMPDRFLSWEMQVWHTYLLIRDDSEMQELVMKINDCYRDNVKGASSSWEIQQLGEIHLHSAGFQYDEAVKGDIRNVYFFLSLAVFTILIACINFVNLSTARSGTRAKEVCMRKVSGAKKSEIIAQFFGESISLSLISVIAAFILLIIVLPYYNGITGKTITFIDVLDIRIIFGIIFIALLSGVLSGIYPALYMSSFQPVQVLKGVLNVSSRKSMFRKILVVIQSSFTVILIFGTIIINKQLNYISDVNLGFNKDNIIYFEQRPGIAEQFGAFKERLIQDPGVSDVTSGFVPVGIGSWTTPGWEGKQQDVDPHMYRSYVDHNYMEFYEMEISDGRFFSEDLSSDTLNYVLNEAAVRAMELEEPIGKRFYIGRRMGLIIGVVKDFHYKSLHSAIEPFIFLMSPVERHLISLRISSENIDRTLDHIESVWNVFAADFPFEYQFLDDEIDKKYRSEKQAGLLFKYFTGLAIFIAGLGLFGMASYLSEQRTREIGIRKVFGAKPRQVIRLLSSEFSKWIIIANIIAFPAGWYAMDQWLMGFAFRIDIDILSFLVSGFLSIAIAIAAVGYQSVKAATTDPVKTLRWG
ncbi:MAG: FtsX-like permease family protein [bacterium]|nr:FtsX-like permease family protein [bacterium]